MNDGMNYQVGQFTPSKEYAGSSVIMRNCNGCRRNFTQPTPVSAREAKQYCVRCAAPQLGPKPVVSHVDEHVAWLQKKWDINVCNTNGISYVVTHPVRG
jgi:hypothetical protein